MRDFGVKFGEKVKMTNEDIDDIMVSALEGGVTYWCDRANVEGKYLGEYASDQISRGGVLMLHDNEEHRWYRLTKGKLLHGLRLYLRNNFIRAVRFGVVFVGGDGNIWLNCGQIDAIVADAIVQYALFDDVVYG